MSRHRTTRKMHRASTVLDESGPAETVSQATEESDAQPSSQSAADLETPSERNVTEELDDKAPALTMETLGRYLAAEVSLREAGEQHSTALFARYFKLTLVMAGFNMLVAGASVAMLFSRSDRVQTVLVTQPAVAPSPQPLAPPQPLEQVVTAPPAAPAVATPPPAAPIPTPPRAAPTPAKLHLLGQPPSLAPRRAQTAVAVTARPARVAPKPLPSQPVVVARNTDEDHTLEQSKQTERW